VRSKIDEQDGDVAVQMAPLIDCVFLLLIFFLVATTLKEFHRKLPVELPDAATAVETKEPPNLVRIGLDRQGRLYLDGEPTSVAGLHRRLRLIAEQAPATPVWIEADRYCDYQSVLHLVDQCRFWGVRNVGFQLRPQRPEK
jgi:biopolymer transport protein ExbD